MAVWIFQLHVTQGGGRFVSAASGCEFIYGRIREREKVTVGHWMILMFRNLKAFLGIYSYLLLRYGNLFWFLNLILIFFLNLEFMAWLPTAMDHWTSPSVQCYAKD